MNVLVKKGRPFHFRGKARLLSLIAANSGTRRARLFDSVFELDLEDLIQRYMYWGTYETNETRLVQQYLRPGMTFVDVGANVGYYTALAAKQVGIGGRVIAFEPSPYAFEKLQSMVAGNRLEQVTAVHAGLSDTAGQGKLYLDASFHNHSPSMVAHENPNATATEIKVARLDDEATRLGIDRIDLMKIDVEGHEPKVLAGAKRLLSEGRVGAILCEFNEYWLSNSGSSPSHLGNMIRDAGFVGHENPRNEVENCFFQLSRNH
jgi:FkbM family methyltransferase